MYPYNTKNKNSINAQSEEEQDIVGVMKKLITTTENDIIFYKDLIELFNDNIEKDIIKSIYLNKNLHLKYLKHAYQVNFNKQYLSDKNDYVYIEKDIRTALLNELNYIEIIKYLLIQTKDKELKKLIFEILLDNFKNCIKLNCVSK